MRSKEVPSLKDFNIVRYRLAAAKGRQRREEKKKKARRKLKASLNERIQNLKQRFGYHVPKPPDYLPL